MQNSLYYIIAPNLSKMHYLPLCRQYYSANIKTRDSQYPLYDWQVCDIHFTFSNKTCGRDKFVIGAANKTPDKKQKVQHLKKQRHKTTRATVESTMVRFVRKEYKEMPVTPNCRTIGCRGLYTCEVAALLLVDIATKKLRYFACQTYK